MTNPPWESWRAVGLLVDSHLSAKKRQQPFWKRFIKGLSSRGLAKRRAEPRGSQPLWAPQRQPELNDTQSEIGAMRRASCPKVFGLPKSKKVMRSVATHRREKSDCSLPKASRNHTVAKLLRGMQGCSAKSMMLAAHCQICLFR